MSRSELLLHREVGPLACNCYVVGDRATRRALLIDPGGDADDLAAAISELGVTITAIVATHAHFDHILAAERLRELTGAAFHMHDADRPLLDWMDTSARMFLGRETGPPPEVDTSLAEGDVLSAGGSLLQVVHTPGHSPGSVTLVGDGTIFCGDTLFAGSVGRTDLPGGDARALVDAIQSKLFEYPGDWSVYPGHGPSTSIEREKRQNPFVGAAARLWLPDA